MFTSRFMPMPFLSPDDGANPGGDSTTDANPGGQQGDGGTPKQPFAVFPDADTFTARMDREATARLKQRAESLGFESIEEMLTAAGEHKATAEAQKTELDRLKDAAAKADNERKTALQTANARVVNAEARVQATALGIKPERVSAALKLADLSQVTVDEQGEPDGAAIKAALEAVLADLPELKGEQGQRAAGGIPASPRAQGGPQLTPQERLQQEIAAQRARRGH